MTRRGQPPSPLRPTVMGAVTPRKRAKPGLGEAPAKPLLEPGPRSATMMPGTTPQRITVDPADLAGLAPGATDAVVKAAQGLLAKIVPGHLDDHRTLFWGQTLQETHRRLLDARIAFMKSPLLQEAPLHLSRLRSLLLRFDPEALATPGGLMAASFRSVSRTIDTPAELSQARAEIETLLRLLTTAGEGLVKLKTQLSANGDKLVALADEVEATALAAAWLAETADPRFVRALRERRDSLRTTAIQIRSGQMLHEGEADLPGRLVLSIQNLALVALPAWLHNLSLFEAKLVSGRAPSLTEARDLAFRLQDLIPQFPRME